MTAAAAKTKISNSRGSDSKSKRSAAPSPLLSSSLSTPVPPLLIYPRGRRDRCAALSASPALPLVLWPIRTVWSVCDFWPTRRRFHRACLCCGEVFPRRSFIWPRGADRVSAATGKTPGEGEECVCERNRRLFSGIETTDTTLSSFSFFCLFGGQWERQSETQP